MSQLEQYASSQNKTWAEVFNAQKLTFANIDKINNHLNNQKVPLTSTDTELVVFGSIARGECTLKSDVDWTLLVDGQASMSHLNIAHLTESAIVSTGLAEPGKSGMFGQITFSHDLIHYIGGQDDTNHNLSRRILLLLESASINNMASKEGTALDRVIRGIIAKYVDNDSGYVASGKENVPRFLLNDIIRFWRTMCVDFAYKQIEQHGDKWALRNIKLRMARRLIYVKGLLMCARLFETDWDIERIKEELRNYALTPPIEFMVATFIEYGISNDIISQALDTYNVYLGLLNNEGFREEMTSLNMYKAYGNANFEMARENSHRFLNALTNVFLNEENKIGRFTIKYGVF